MKKIKIFMLLLLSAVLIGNCAPTQGRDQAKPEAARQLIEILESHRVSPVFTALERESNFKEKSRINLVDDISPVNRDGTVEAVVEIYAGSNEMWQVSQDGFYLEWKFKNNIPEVIPYTGCPGNYGFIPAARAVPEGRTHSELLDIIVLGNPMPRGKVIETKLIGILTFEAQGKEYRVLLGLHRSSAMYDAEEVRELEQNYPGVLNILITWFENFEGRETMKFVSLGNHAEADRVLRSAIEAYKEFKQ